MSIVRTQGSWQATTASLPLLLDEITHRVVNEYTEAVTMLSIASARTADAAVRAMLLDSVCRLQAFAAAHRALRAPRATGSVDLGGYLGDVCGALAASRAYAPGIEIALDCDTIAIEATCCWYLALIMSELVENAVRHGCPDGRGRVAIQVRRQQGRVHFLVADDGCCAMQPMPGRGSGRRIVEQLAAVLGGAVTWHFDPRSTRVLLSFPLQTGCDEGSISTIRARRLQSNDDRPGNTSIHRPPSARTYR